MGCALGGWSERVERPEDIAGVLTRARKATEGGQAALLELITGQQTCFSNRGVLR
jgi:acetolactate synthase I/II/III large subunit